ncbi:MAG: protein kinase [Candidatus Melainabacteria bacterium]|nr:protein kinase [Candidatus Melainabacteria bacterium]
MSETLCKKCGKQKLADRAGSLTSYFFQHNYCQCSSGRPVTINKSAEQESICGTCGRARTPGKRAGSFTSFLFKELRCDCAVPTPSKSNRTTGDKRTQTSERVAQKKQFTESLISFKKASGDSASQIMLPVGTTIGGMFKALSLIGTGGMAAVYLAEHTTLRKKVAVKVLAPDLVNQKNWLRFQAEAKTMASLHHPSFVSVYDLGIHDGEIPFYAMDYVDGRSLEEILAETGPIELERTLDIFLAVINGLAYAHRNGIIHRDIKPANIMLCTANSNSTIRILDFGISKLVGAAASQDQSMTKAGDIFGSPYYMSPEQCLGESVDARSDIYSIGCSLFETLTGFVPFEGTSQLETVMMHQEDTPPLLSEVLPEKGFTTSLDAVISTCLAKLPRNRYQTAKELAVDLERIKQGRDIQASSPAYAQLMKLEQKDEDSEAGEYENEDESARLRLAARLPKLARSVIDFFLKAIKSDKLISSLLTLVIAACVLFLLRSAANLFFISTGKTEVEGEIANKLEKYGLKGLPDVLSNKQKTDEQPYYSKIVDSDRIVEFDFPENQSIGKIGLMGDRKNFRKAQGKVYFPRHSAIEFWPNDYFFSLPQMFDKFRPEDLFSLSLNNEIRNRHDLRESMPSIAKLTSLIELDIENTAIGDDEIVFLNKLKHLFILKIENTKITGNGIAYLARLKDLKSLSFGSNKDLHKMLAALQGSHEIDELSLNSAEVPLSESDAELIATCKSLKHLELDGSVTSDKVLSILSGLPRLEYVSLRDCILSKHSIDDFRKAYLPRQIEIVLSEASNNAHIN